jgi:hypothetical protein
MLHIWSETENASQRNEKELLHRQTFFMKHFTAVPQDMKRLS